MARLRKLKRDDGPGGSSGKDDSSTGENESSTDENGSRTEEDSTTENTTTSSSTTTTPRSSPSPVSASTTSSPTSPSINPSDIVTASGGQTVFRTVTRGQTETITTGQAQSASASPAAQRANSSPLSSGAKAGIGVAVVLSTLLAAVVLFFLFRRRRAMKMEPNKAGIDSRGEVADMSFESPPESGHQTLQSLGYGGIAELHNEDKVVETGGRPVYEMSGSAPNDRGNADDEASETGDPPEYTPMAQTSTTSEPGGQEHSIISPVGDDSVTYAPGDIVSPLDTKIRY